MNRNRKIIALILLLLLLPLLVIGCNRKTETELKYDIEDFRKALYFNDIETIKTCIELGNVENISYEFLDALGRGSLANNQVFELILEHGADPNYTRWVNMNSRERLVKQQHTFPLARAYVRPTLVKMLIDHGADVNKLVEPDANLLMLYIENLSLRYWDDVASESIRILLENGVDANFRGETGLTPLLMALNYCETEAARILLEYVKPTAQMVRIDFDYDPLEFRRFDEDYGIVWQSDFLMMAVNSMHDVLMPYIENGVITPDHATPNGHDIYYFAAEGGDHQMMMKLLPYLKNINTRLYNDRRHTGMTLFHVAAMNGNGEAVKVLLANGIDPDIKAVERASSSAKVAWELGNLYAYKSNVSRIILDFEWGREDYAEYRITK